MGQEPVSLQDLIQKRQQTGFVGRHGEVAQYQENLGLPADDERRMFLFSIHGDAGVGKTYLTQHLWRLAARQGALTAYINETVEDPAGAMSAIAGQFGSAGDKMSGFEKRVTLVVNSLAWIWPALGSGFISVVSRPLGVSPWVVREERGYKWPPYGP